MMDGHTPDALVSLLAWYREMGVDAAVSDTPTDWLMRGDEPPGHAFRLPQRDDAAEAQPERAPGPRANLLPSAPATPPAATRKAPANPPAPATRRFPTEAPDIAVAKARALAEAAGDIAALERALKAFDGCALKQTAKNLCSWRGSVAARVMLLGAAPDSDDDRTGTPFAGAEGVLLDKMLAAAGFADGDVHISNIVYWRPPGNRQPTPQEYQICRPFLDRQVTLVKPDIIVPLGDAAAKNILQVEESVNRLRGRWRTLEIAGRTVKAMTMLHPHYLLQNPAQKRQAWMDLLNLRVALDEARVTSRA